MTTIVSSLFDPPDQSVLTQASYWVEATMLGSVATAIGVIAVASIGMAMLWGHLSLRRAATVLAGCFLIFGSGTIARGLAGASNLAPVALPRESTPIFEFPEPPVSPQSRSDNYDPYAGAAAPRR